MPTLDNPLPDDVPKRRIVDARQSPSVVETIPPEPATSSCIELSRDALRLFRRVWTAWMVLATTLPYLWNYFARPQGSRYAWILPPSRDDSYGYMAWSQQAAHGAMLFKLKFTALPHTPSLFQPFFLICGWASRFTGANLGVVHLVAKEIGVVLF